MFSDVAAQINLSWQCLQYMLVSGLICTPAIRRYGPGPCVIVGCMVGCLGFIVSSLANSVPIIVVCTGVVAGIQ